ncbi:putative hemolysin [Methylobacillus pratensis]
MMIFRVTVFLMTCSVMAGCSSGSGQKPAKLDMANPASVYCVNQGGKIEFQKDASGGTIGMCHLPDGTVVEEWELFRRDYPVPKG